MRALPHLRALALIGVALLALAPASLALGRPTLPALEPQLMCVTCKIPLSVADSAEATQERELIKELIAKGDGEGQIKKVLVSQYGPAVLSTPSTKGFQLSAYLVPIVVVVALIGGQLLAVRPFQGETERGIAISLVLVGQHLHEGDRLASLAELASKGVLTLRIAELLPAERAAEAHRRLDAGGVRGRLVLVF